VTGGREDEPGRSLGLASLPNLRDVGGYPTRDGGRVRTGLLYRSGELSGLDGADAAVFAGLGIRAVFDLRSEAERAMQPDRLPAGTEQIEVDVVRDSTAASPRELMALLADPRAASEALAGGRAAAMWAAMYRELVHLPSARAGYGRLFGDLAHPRRRPALFHCTTGKDRTGWAAAALLLLLGVPDDLVMADYLASGPHLRALAQPWLDRIAALGSDPELIRPIMDVRPEYLEAAIDEMGRRFGTVEGYFADGLGVGTAAQIALRVALVEPA
jgi:protein-tyrosine phosphatase